MRSIKNTRLLSYGICSSLELSDPRTMTLEDAEKVWQEKQDAKKAKTEKAAAKKTAKTPAKPKPKNK